MRYSGDLEGIQEKWGGQGLCCSLFPGGGSGGESVLDVPEIYFLEEQQILKEKS